MKQPELDFARARTNDPGTSHVAARGARAFAGEHCRKILAALRATDGLTIYELERATGLDHVAIARRLPELQSQGAAVPTDETRPGSTGRPCRVWRVA